MRVFGFDGTWSWVPGALGSESHVDDLALPTHDDKGRE